jgi:hypothetical protein
MITTMRAGAKKADANPIIQDALRRELALFETRERLTLSEIEDIERKYGMTSPEFCNKFESGALGDDQDYFVWWSLIRGLEAVRTRKSRIGYKKYFTVIR